MISPPSTTTAVSTHRRDNDDRTRARRRAPRLRRRTLPGRGRRRSVLSHGTFLRRGDFTSRFIQHGTSISDPATRMAIIDWPAAITALGAGEPPCSGGERRVLRLAASLAGGIPVDPRDAIPGLDERNTSLLLTAIEHAFGKRPTTWKDS